MDLYHIPGDTGGDWRIGKFVEYQHEVPSIHYRVMGNYIVDWVPDRDDAVMMCWYMSATYNEITCMEKPDPENSKGLLSEILAGGQAIP